MTDRFMVMKTGEPYWWQNSYIIAPDDGFFSLSQDYGVSRSYTLLNTGDYSGSVQISVGIASPETEYISNNCVRDERTGLMWIAQVVPQTVGYSGLLPFDDHVDVIDGSSQTGTFTAGEMIVQATTSYSAPIRYADNTSSYLGIVNVSNRPFDTGKIVTGQSSTATMQVDAYNQGDGFDIFALAHACNVAQVGGHADWRVPNLFELATLAYFSVTNADAYPDDTYFDLTGLSANITIGATHKGGGSQYVHRIQYSNGGTTRTRNKFYPDTNRLFLVRGPLTDQDYPCKLFATGFTEQSSAGYPDDGWYKAGESKKLELLTTGEYAGTTDWLHGDGTYLTASQNCVEDQDTGLMWMADVVLGDTDYGQAAGDGACSHYAQYGKRKDAWSIVRKLNMMNHAGYRDWRLPNLFEALSIMRFNASVNLTIHETYFTNPSYLFHLSTTRPDSVTSVYRALASSSLWGTSFVRDAVGWASYVRAVRGGYKDSDV